MNSPRSLYLMLFAIGIAILVVGCSWPSQIVAAAAIDTNVNVSKPLEDKWLIHEWGTFTCLQDETGRTIGGINTDDEPLPSFVHTVMEQLVTPDTALPVNELQKGLAFHRSSYLPVTMRLETPVIYFYPPVTALNPQHIDVTVSFKGGWLSEFYPQADAVAPGIERGGAIFANLSESTTGSLSWSNLTVGGTTSPPVTSSRVWLAPRDVSASPVQTTSGESEKYLFYRGVAHIDSPVYVVQKPGRQLEVFVRERGSWPQVAIRNCWLVSVRPDRSIAFRQPTGANRQSGATTPIFVCDRTFNTDDYGGDSLVQLRKSMTKALMVEGLFSEEADAMLNTWEAAYFQTVGTRLFYIVPRTWTDRVLPLHVSVAGETVRVMVGRIELATAEHRELLRRIASLTPPRVMSGRPEVMAQQEQSQLKWLEPARSSFITQERDVPALYERARSIPLTGSSFQIPEAYKAYLALGRFRDALLLDYADTASPPDSEQLRAFAQLYQVHRYTIMLSPQRNPL